MRYWYDCEFLEDGVTIAPISIGIVAEDGRELYLINQGIEWTDVYGDLHDRICDHNWLMENVVPHLPVTSVQQPGPTNVYPRKSGSFNIDCSDNRVVPLRFIRNAVRDFLLADGGPVELWGYYSSYDHILLCQLWGKMIDLPAGIPMWTNDVQQEAARLGLDLSLPKQAGNAHNALDDARWTRDAWTYLMSERPSHA
jgi:hypothetical protein